MAEGAARMARSSLPARAAAGSIERVVEDLQYGGEKGLRLSARPEAEAIVLQRGSGGVTRRSLEAQESDHRCLPLV